MTDVYARFRRSVQEAVREADRLVRRYGGDPSKAKKPELQRLVALCRLGLNTSASEEAKLVALMTVQTDMFKE